ncbi:MAG: O-succinylbenzoic acid--CoA ligase [Verrucomicrobia bacterium]|nr:O-succinylbenzoic acid--CoA ligase [Verrucomicrobiota bacterium]
MDRAELRKLLAATGCAEESGGFTFLCDPKWSLTDRALASAAAQSAIRNPPSAIESGWLCIPTGGSSGGVRFARHDERTLTAAARGFCAHFGFDRVNAVGVLPAHHVSGLMARVRCAETGGEHVAWDWKRLEAGERPRVSGNDWVLSLVPTQLQRLMALPESLEWLRAFRVIFIGGAPIWPELADSAARAGLPLSLSYGMTETAAMVAALKPGEFLGGDRTSGAALPHARVAVSADGVVSVAGESVFRGYFPEERATREFVTEDLGELDARGHLRFIGRRVAVIISGGKKIQPAEIEAFLRATGRFADVAVLGVPDAEWGQAVVACYLEDGRIGSESAINEEIGRELSGHKRPKRYVPVAPADWPRNAQGKLNRAALLALVSKYHGSPDP